MLRLAGANRKRIDLGDGDWIEVKQELSKREFMQLVQSLPEEVQRKAEDTEADTVSFKVRDAVAFVEALFQVCVTDWSLEGVEPTIDNYARLARESADQIDALLMDHFKELVPSKAEEGKPSTSPGRRRKG